MLKILEAWNMQKWSEGDLQDMINIYLHLTSKNLKFDQVLSQYIEYRRHEAERTSIVLKYCPECGQPMKLATVNDTKANQVGGEYESQWFCSNCGYDIFSKKSTIEEYEKTLKTRTKEQ